jgi:nucleoid-associated protein YgaU
LVLVAIRLDIEQLFGSLSNVRSVLSECHPANKPSGPDQEGDMQTTRLQLSVQLSVLLATVCVVFLLIGGAADAEEPPGPTTEYVVARGDTLWEIASAHVGAGEDVRIYIDAIKESSGISSSSLQVGQVLRIPQP